MPTLPSPARFSPHFDNSLSPTRIKSASRQESSEMGNTTDTARPVRFGAIIFPMAAIGVSLAAAMVIAADLRGPITAYDIVDPTAVQGIQFVALTASSGDAALHDALAGACDVTGCDPETLHPMILASVARMTEAELRAALDAQARVQAESLAVRNRSLPGTDSARMAEMELLAGERIAALYEQELNQR